MEQVRHTNPITYNDSKRNRRSLYSPRLGRMVTLYSPLEYDHYIAVEHDPDIEAFCEQPVRIKVSLGGKPYTTVLDMWVLYRNGYEEYREIKPSNAVTEPENELQIRAETSWCQLQEIPFRLVTELDIGLSTQALENLKQIQPYLINTSWIIQKGLDGAVYRYMQQVAQTTLGELESTFSASPATEVNRAAFLLLHRGLVEADLTSSPLSKRTLIKKLTEHG